MRRISRSQLAELAGVSKSAITQACESGKLRQACAGDGVDVDHAAVVAYLAKRGRKPPAAPSESAGKSKAPATAPDRAPPKPTKSKPAPAAAPTPPPKRGRGRPRNPPQEGPEPRGHFQPRDGVGEGSSDDLQDLDDALSPLIDRFGTHFQFSSWLGSLKDIELIREKRLKNGETEGGLISRKLVQDAVLGLVEQAFKRLLGDASKSIVSKVSTTIRAGGSTEEAQRNVRDELSKHLKPIKAAAVRHLKHKSDGEA